MELVSRSSLTSQLVRAEADLINYGEMLRYAALVTVACALACALAPVVFVPIIVLLLAGIAYTVKQIFALKTARKEIVEALAKLERTNQQ